MTWWLKRAPKVIEPPAPAPIFTPAVVAPMRQPSAPPPKVEQPQLSAISDPLSANTRALLERLHDDIRKAKDAGERGEARRFLLDVLGSLRGVPAAPQADRGYVFASPTASRPPFREDREPLPGHIDRPEPPWQRDEREHRESERARLDALAGDADGGAFPEETH